MRYHLFQTFFGKMVKVEETSFLSTREDTYFLLPLYVTNFMFLDKPILKLEPYVILLQI